MHILQSENRTAGHAQPLWTLEADKTPMRKKNIYLYMGFFLLFFINIIVELSQTPGSSSSPHYGTLQLWQKKKEKNLRKNVKKLNIKAERFVNNCCQLKQINMVLLAISWFFYANGTREKE